MSQDGYKPTYASETIELFSVTPPLLHLSLQNLPEKTNYMENLKRLSFSARTGKQELRWTHFPYCVKLVTENPATWVIVNRRSKPLGFFTFDMLDYDQFSMSLRGANAARKNLDYRGDAVLDLPWPHDICLYADCCVPTSSTANMTAYLQRLGLLLSMTAEF